MSKYIVRDERGNAVAMIGDYQYKQILDKADIEFGVETFQKLGKLNIVKIMSDCSLSIESEHSMISVFLIKGHYIHKHNS